MGAAAGAPIEIRRIVTMRSVPSPVRSLAEPRGRSRFLEADLAPAGSRSRPRWRAPRPPTTCRVAEAGRVEIERGALPAEMHAHGRVSEPLGDHRGEQVLTGVLLHVVEAARPVDRAGDPVAGPVARATWAMRSPSSTTSIDRHVAEPAGVERLARRRWDRRRCGRGRSGGRRRRGRRRRRRTR